MEIWASVLGWEGIYEVSDTGRVRSLPLSIQNPRKDRPRKYRYLKPWLTHGYPYVILSRNGRQERIACHRLVMRAFHGMPTNGEEVCHNNGIRADCRLSNLRYASRSENHADKVIHGTSLRGEQGSNVKLKNNDVLSIRSDCRSQKIIAEEYGIGQAQVSRIKSGIRWGHL